MQASLSTQIARINKAIIECEVNYTEDSIRRCGTPLTGAEVREVMQEMIERGFTNLLWSMTFRKAPFNKALGKGCYGVAYTLPDGRVLKLGKFDATSCYHARVWAECEARGPYHRPLLAPRVEDCGIVARPSHVKYGEWTEEFIFWAIMEHVVTADAFSDANHGDSFEDTDQIEAFESYWQTSFTDNHNGNWGYTTESRLVFLDVATRANREVVDSETFQLLLNRRFPWL